MLSIAGGIILALLILAFLPEFFLLIIYIFGIVLAVFIFLLVLGLLSDSNYADVIATLTLCSFLGLSYFLHDTYIQSRSLRLFGRKLIILATLTLSPKKQVEKEIALECLQQDIVLHCENKNLAIKNKTLDATLQRVSKFLYKYREYGDLIASQEGNVIKFSIKDIGYLFKVQVSTNFPKSVSPIYLIEGYQATNISELKSHIKNIVKRKILDYERSKQHKK